MYIDPQEEGKMMTFAIRLAQVVGATLSLIEWRRRWGFSQGESDKRLHKELASTKWQRGNLAGMETKSVPNSAVPTEMVGFMRRLPPIELELVRVYADVPLHFHGHSISIIFPVVRGNCEILLQYMGAQREWVQLGESGLQVLEPRRIHGFRNVSASCTFLSVNYPPLADSDVVRI